MKRREFISLLGGAAAAWPLAARAQQPAMPVIGFLDRRSPETFARPSARFPPGPERDGLCRGRERHDRIPLGRGQMDRLPELAADLVRRQVAVIAAAGGPARRWRPRRRPRRSPSFSAPARTRSGSASSRASTGRAAT